MTKLICGHCKEKIHISIKKGKSDCRNIPFCPNCYCKLSSSKKTFTGNATGSQHIHEEYKNGDVIY